MIYDRLLFVAKSEDQKEEGLASGLKIGNPDAQNEGRTEKDRPTQVNRKNLFQKIK